MISISNIFQNGKYCFFLLTVLPNTGMLKLSSSVVFADCSFCSCSTGHLLRELLGPAVCVATLLSALRSKVTATLLLSVSSFFAYGVVFFCFFRLLFASVVVVVVIADVVISHVALGRLRTGTFQQLLCFCHGQVNSCRCCRRHRRRHCVVLLLWCLVVFVLVGEEYLFFWPVIVFSWNSTWQWHGTIFVNESSPEKKDFESSYGRLPKISHSGINTFVVLMHMQSQRILVPWKPFVFFGCLRMLIVVYWSLERI